MDTIALRIGGEKLYLWFIMAIGLVVAAFLGMFVGTDSVNTVIVLAAVGSTFAWISVARKRWWLIVPALGSIGGFFYFGFKIYPHEVALLGCAIPLGISLTLSRNVVIRSERSRFPVALYFLAVYLVSHWVVSGIYNRLNGEGGFGNVSRVYFSALWVIFFLFAFRRYGSSKYLPAALMLIYVSSVLRVLCTVILYLFRSFAYVPVINYVLPGAAGGGVVDLRTSGLTLGTLAMCYLLFRKGFISKFFHSGVLLCSFVAVFLGAGRVSLVLVGLVPIFAALLYRKAIPVLCSILAACGVLLVLNNSPTVLNDLPLPVQRSASILLLDKGEAQKYGQTGSSDVWHAELRQIGFKKWTQDWNSFVFGTGIRPFDRAILEDRGSINSFSYYLDSSAKVGAYESGWWTVIAVTGALGMIAYVAVLFYLSRRLLPILFREKVRDHAHAFAFMAMFNIIIWFSLGWTNGSFPSTEIMFGFLALFALEDKKQARPARTPLPPQDIVPLRQRRTLQTAR